MNALKRQQRTQQSAAQSKPAPSLRVAREDDSATQSHAIALQSYIEAEFAEPAGPRRWPLAISLPLIGAVSAGLWVAIIAAARAVLG